MAASSEKQNVRGTGGGSSPVQPRRSTRVLHSEHAEAAKNRAALAFLKQFGARSDTLKEDEAKRWPIGTIGLAAAITSMLLVSYSYSGERHIVPRTGIGYALGIIGSTMMALLLFYPLRKYWAPLSRAGSVRVWFQTHMVLGILGPSLILVHSNFEYQARNSIVAMSVMLLVVVSGLVGRYIYSQVYVGLSGQREELTHLLDSSTALLDQISGGTEKESPITEELRAIGERARELRFSRLGGLKATILLPLRLRRSRARLRAEIVTMVSACALREKWDAAKHRRQVEAAMGQIDRYFATLRKASTLHFFTRLFGVWHLFHMPLFLFLVLAATGHIIAVHLY